MPKTKQFLQMGLLIFTFTLTGPVGAHAVVTESSLKVDPIAPNQATKVSINFNSNIELALSQIFLVRAGDKQELLHAERGAKPGQIILDIPALETGEYALRFKVFAADGHLTEDIIRFFVTQ